MKRTLLLAAVSAALLSASAATASYTVEVRNTAKLHIPDAPVAIAIADFAPAFNPQSATLRDGDTEIPVQLDDLDGDGIVDEVAFVADLLPRQRRRLDLTLSDAPAASEAEPRTWAGLQLYGRKKGEFVDINELGGLGSVNYYNMVHGHGVMLESELVGYRVYFNEKQTLDPYGKFTPRLELEACRFYPTDAQLADGFGDDVLLAGNSCGIGALKGWDGEKAVHIAPVASRTQRVVARGPVRAIAETAVTGWDRDGRKLDMTNRYTIYAGHRDVRIDSRFSRPLTADDRFATGVERVMGTETTDFTDGRGLVASWGRHWPVNDTIKYAKETIGIATFVPAPIIAEPADDGDNLLYVIAAPGQTSFTHYTMFTSRKETFTDFTAETWFDTLAVWRRRLEAASSLKITVTPR